MNGLSLAKRLRFAEFELDLRTGELLTHGQRVKLQDQPFQILVKLLEHPGELVTREELIQKLWPNNTFVDFDHSLNKAINKLRLGLEDSSDSPRFIETLARRGYRFIGTIDDVAAEAASNAPSQAEPASSATAPPAGAVKSFQWIWAMAALALLVVAVVVIRRQASSHNRTRVESIAVLPLANVSGDTQQDYF